MTTIEEYKSQLQALGDTRKTLEDKIASLREQEKCQLNGRSIGCALVDEDDYPLSDVDVHAVRIIRNEAATLQNDYTALMKNIEKTMFDMHKQAKMDYEIAKAAAAENTKKSENTETTTQATTSTPSQSSILTKVLPEEKEMSSLFWIRTVLENSPADKAQFHIDDEVISFNGRPSSDESTTTFVSNIVRNSINRPIRVVIKRKPVRVLMDALYLKDVTQDMKDATISETSQDNQRKSQNEKDDSNNLQLSDDYKTRYFVTELTPTKWEGPGYLGCEIVPF